MKVWVEATEQTVPYSRGGWDFGKVNLHAVPDWQVEIQLGLSRLTLTVDEAQELLRDLAGAVGAVRYAGATMGDEVEAL